MKTAFALVCLLTRLAFFGLGFAVRVRLSARAYRRRLIRAGVPREHAEILYREFKETGLISLLK
ncbi:hypothetical protein DRJ12_04990 [Candidatus Acetothermia bacterium]|nr:MAG: hypothetical protein DRJ12_04990 [Candidatus Acetothermia bacterium]